MSNTSVRYLNLDEIKSPIDFVIVSEGQEHKLVEATVEDFIANTQDVQALGVSSSIVEETELTVRMMKRAFPTFPEASIRKLTLSKIRELVQFARGVNGEVETENKITEVADAENPPAVAA